MKEYSYPFGVDVIKELLPHRDPFLMLDEVIENTPSTVDFWEVAPENWLTFGGAYQRKFSQLTSKNTFTTHGLSLSIGSFDALDTNFVKQVNKRQAQTLCVVVYFQIICAGLVSYQVK